MLTAPWRWRRQLRVPLRVKAAILVGGAAAVAVLCFGVLQAWLAERDLRARLVDDQVRLAVVVAALAEDYVKVVRNDLLTTARDEGFVAKVVAEDAGDLTQRLETIGQVEPELSALVVVDRSGTIIASSLVARRGVLSSLGNRDYIQAALQTGRPTIGNARRGAETDRPVVPLAVPIRDASGEIVGALQGSLLLTRLSERVNNLHVGQRGYISLVDNTGALIAHPSPALLLTPALRFDDLRAATRNGEPYVAEQATGTNDATFVVAIAVPSTDWLVQIRTPIEEIDAPIRQQLVNTAAAAGSAFAVAIAISLLVSRQLSEPIAELRRASRRLANEDYSAALPNVRTRDELEDVAVDFGTMVRRLRSTMDRLETEAAESEQQRARIAAILQSIDEAIFLVGPAGRVLVANESVRRLFDVDPGSLIDRPVEADPSGGVLGRFRLADPGALNEAIRRAEVDRDRDFSLDVNVVQPVNRELSLTSVPVRDSAGGYVGRLYSFRDVTQERAADRAKTEFVALVSHELRTPLTSIRGFTELLLEGEAGPLTSDQAEFLDIIRNNVGRLSGLVDELLDIARIEAGRVDLTVEDVALGPIVDDVAASLRPQLEANQQCFSIRAPDTPVVVHGDARRVQQILTNLLSNAHKYTPTGGSIALTVDVAPPDAMIAVADSGIGLAPADQRQLFRKFFRAKNRLTEESGGSGLGLVITKSLVELQGGQLTVESIPGRGSTFRFTLPLAASELGGVTVTKAAGRPDAERASG